MSMKVSILTFSNIFKIICIIYSSDADTEAYIYNTSKICGSRKNCDDFFEYTHPAKKAIIVDKTLSNILLK